MLNLSKKIAFLLFIIIGLNQFTFGQTIMHNEVKNENLVYILNNMEVASKYENPNADLFVTVYYVNYSDGSRETESCDASTTVYIAVSEDGEAPEQHLYKLSKLFDVKFMKWTPTKSGVSFTLSYWDKKLKTKTSKINVSLKSLSVVDQPVTQSSPKHH